MAISLCLNVLIQIIRTLIGPVLRISVKTQGAVLGTR